MPIVPGTEMVDEKIRAKVRDGKFVEFKQLTKRSASRIVRGVL